MSSKPLSIGVVTISYNQARFLQEAIDSVHLRDASRLQYVIVDPGSTDGSRAIIEQNRERFSQVIFEADTGPADGLNKGFANCDADIFAFLNSDDRYCPGALDYVLTFFDQHAKTDVLVGSLRFIDAEGRPHWRKRVPRGLAVRDLLDGTMPILQQSTFFRRDTFLRSSGFDPQNRTCWDGQLFGEFLTNGARFSRTYKLLADFRLHSEGISGSGRLTDAFIEEQRTIRMRWSAAGYHPTSQPIRAARQVWDYLNPVRRFWEVFSR